MHRSDNFTLRKSDWILMCFLLLLAALCLVLFTFHGKEPGSLVRVRVDGKIYQEYPLDRNQEISIKTEYGTNILSIEDHVVSMKDADCPDRYCVQKGAIRARRETIICLPHHLAVEIVEGPSFQKEEAPGSWEVDVYAG